MKILSIRNWLIFLLTAALATGVVIYAGRLPMPEPKTKLITPVTDAQLKKMIGQMIIIGFRGTEASPESEIAKAIKYLNLGGVVLSDYDIPSKSFPMNITSPEQVKKLISGLKTYSPFLFVAVDAEGGKVNRLKPEYGFSPILSASDMGKDKTTAITSQEAEKLANELQEAGFNMNFAPVVDLNLNPQNLIIGGLGRSFSADPENVITQARVFIKAHHIYNIITVAKHFPGHGSSPTDSHMGLVDVTYAYKNIELNPYIELQKESLLDAVMVSHITNRNIDKDLPATLSPAFLQTILRQQIGFRGVIISDDMQMEAITSQYEFKDSLAKAINAGCDIIAFTNNSQTQAYDKNLAYKISDAIFEAVKENQIPRERIIESYNRILDLKKKFEIIQSAKNNELKIAEIKSKNFELLGTPETLTFEEALGIAKYVEGITGARSAFLLAVLQEELALEKSDLCYLTNFNTGEGIRVIGNETLLTGKILQKVMEPKRDIPEFLKITRELGKDPLKTLVTCPMSFGWGGAMGPADFIPSTWMRYKDRIEKITSKPADPWDIKDAFLAAGLYLSDSGAKTKTRKGEWNAAMIYFSGSIDSPYTWYANGVIAIADKIQTDIETIEKIVK